MKRISSANNPLIKHILRLKEKSSARRRSGLFVVEGHRELSLALKGGYAMETVLFEPGIISEAVVRALFKGTEACPKYIEISGDVYRKIAYRETTEGILAIGKAKEFALSRLSFTHDNPLILVAEAPEKPGNIGALLRTADAAGLDAVIIANPKTDLFNPNIIRSSVGGVFTNRIATGKTTDIITFLKKRNIDIYAAALTASKPYHSMNFRSASAIVVGTEAEGLSKEWLYHATENIIIPMQGEIDSMNVSVSAAILVFEARRQRGFQQEDGIW